MPDEQKSYFDFYKTEFCYPRLFQQLTEVLYTVYAMYKYLYLHVKLSLTSNCSPQAPQSSLQALALRPLRMKHMSPVRLL